MNYHAFTRTWWIHNPEWPNGLEPCPGPKRTKAHFKTEGEARAYCMDFNAKLERGEKMIHRLPIGGCQARLGYKCEFEEE